MSEPNNKIVVKKVYHLAKDIRCEHGSIFDGYIELWSEGPKMGVLLSHGRTRAEAYENAANKLKASLVEGDI